MRSPSLCLLVFCAGCAQIAPAPPPPVAYVCEGGRTFSVAYSAAGDAATIEIDRMRFLLAADAAGGSRYACSELMLWREGDSARVERAGGAALANCRVRR